MSWKKTVMTATELWKSYKKTARKVFGNSGDRSPS